MSTRVTSEHAAASRFVPPGPRRPVSGHRPVEDEVSRRAAVDRLLLGLRLH